MLQDKICLDLSFFTRWNSNNFYTKYLLIAYFNFTNGYTS